MKKLIITLTILAALTLTACGNNNDEVVTSTTTAATTTDQEEATTTTPAEVEDITTTTVTDEVTTEITTIPEEVTTEATTTTEAAPAWVDEPMDNTTMYATTACYVRKDAVVGSDALYVVTAGKAVTIVGKTDTGYYKLSDGGYIHSDYLSTQKPVEEVVTTTAPVQTEEPTTTTEAPAPSYDLPEYNLTGATYKGIEIVITEEDIEAINNEIFRLTNELRVSLGLNELQRNSTLDAGVRIRAHELTANYSHTRPNGTNWYTVYTELGTSYAGMGENCSTQPLNVSQNTLYLSNDGKYHINVNSMAANVITSWKNSAGHYQTMTNPSYKYIEIDSDVGYALNNMSELINYVDRYYFFSVQNFKS